MRYSRSYKSSLPDSSLCRLTSKDTDRKESFQQNINDREGRVLPAPPSGIRKRYPGERRRSRSRDKEQRKDGGRSFSSKKSNSRGNNNRGYQSVLPYVRYPRRTINSNFDPSFHENSVDREVKHFLIREEKQVLKFRGREKLRLRELTDYSTYLEFLLEKAMNFWLDFKPHQREEMLANEESAENFFVLKFGDLQNWARFSNEYNQNDVGKDVGTRHRIFSNIDILADSHRGSWKTSLAVSATDLVRTDITFGVTLYQLFVTL